MLGWLACTGVPLFVFFEALPLPFLLNGPLALTTLGVGVVVGVGGGFGKGFGDGCGVWVL